MNEVKFNRISTANKIANNLWMGDYPIPFSKLEDEFDCLVLCASEYQFPSLFNNIRIAQANLNDDGTPITRKEAFEAVYTAKKVIDWLKQDLRILVTCIEGRNRSGIVCGLTLCHGPLKIRPTKAIDMIRDARGNNAMSNPWFIKLLHNLSY